MFSHSLSSPAQDFGFLFGVCDDAVWAVLNTPAGGVLRDRPDFPAPAALGANANPAARDAFKRATDSRAAWLACSASFCAAILESIGEANRLAISDPATDTLHLCERLKKERERLDKLGIPSHPLFGSSLSFKELSRADNPKDRAHRRAHREETKIG